MSIKSAIHTKNLQEVVLYECISIWNHEWNLIPGLVDTVRSRYLCDSKKCTKWWNSADTGTQGQRGPSLPTCPRNPSNHWEDLRCPWHMGWVWARPLDSLAGYPDQNFWLLQDLMEQRNILRTSKGLIITSWRTYGSPLDVVDLQVVIRATV